MTVLRRRWLGWLLLAAGIGALLLIGLRDSGEPVVLKTGQGVLVGRDTGGVHRFLGIPYAQPPVGALRWQAPRPLEAPWPGRRDATRFASACVQGAKPTLAQGSSEDCLYLNVWAPAKPGPHPVMVWIHGGGLMIGSANEPPYDGSMLAATQDVIVVTFNYRLSYLGFLSLDGSSAGTDAIAGNQGFLDQVMALQWVHDHIAAFGGDPGKVTVFGESGGGVSTCLLLASPLTQGLMHKAIMQSGVCGIQPVMSREQAQQQARRFLQKIGCADVADPESCARALSPQQIEDRGITPGDILTADSRSFSYYPLAVDDGRFVQGSPQMQLQSENKRGIPILLGTTADEGSLFTGQIAFPQSASAYEADLEQRFPGAGSTIAARYPYAQHQPIGRAYARMFADAMEVCPTRRLAEQQAVTAPVYLYQFTQPPSAPALWLLSQRNGSEAAPLGVHHGAEIPYVFGRNSIVGHVWTQDQQQTRAQLMRYWAQFARTGSPNAEGLPQWPAYHSGDRQYLRISSKPQTGRDLGGETCTVWDQHPEFSFW